MKGLRGSPTLKVTTMSTFPCGRSCFLSKRGSNAQFVVTYASEFDFLVPCFLRDTLSPAAV